MTEKLQKLISLAITDGVITDKERQILLKQAFEAGVDLDEFEMELDARLFERQQELKVETASQIQAPPIPEKPKSNKESISLLKEMGIEISLQNLVYYSQEGKITEVKHLINAGIDPNSKSNEGLYPLIQAVNNGHIDIVKYLLKNNANSNVLDINKRDALTVAAFNGNIEIVELLLNNGAKLNGNEKAICPPIIGAASGNKVKIIELLIEKGANINAVGKDGNTAIKMSHIEGSKEAYEKLVELGATPLSEEELKKENFLEVFKNVLTTIYAKAYLFWAVNIFCFIIIFFVLNEKTGGGYGSRVFAFLFCTIVGGLLGMYWSIKRNGDKIKWFRYGAGTFLMIVTLLLWSNNNYKSPYRNSTKTYSTASYTCPHCDGSGNRINNLTGQYGGCSSCGGDGKVTEEQYNRLSK